MSDLLQKVIQYTPNTWKRNVSYDSNVYQLFEVEENSLEYHEIADYFKRTTSENHSRIREIKRIQHPYAYGRFLLRKEQLNFRHGSVDTVSSYY